MKFPKSCNVFLNRGEKGFVWTFARSDCLYRLFSVPSNGKWKLEVEFRESTKLRFPNRTVTLILGTPKWDVSISRQRYYWHLNAVKEP